MSTGSSDRLRLTLMRSGASDILVDAESTAMEREEASRRKCLGSWWRTYNWSVIEDDDAAASCSSSLFPTFI